MVEHTLGLDFLFCVMFWNKIPQGNIVIRDRIWKIFGFDSILGEFDEINSFPFKPRISVTTWSTKFEDSLSSKTGTNLSKRRLKLNLAPSEEG
ncbi:hypothetical protein AYI68_g726 [Smittium mucronatum]|uniref:Uncharacterized protein n=1 Tax=Smittium mucronatum TaxID=133383 RepID=A0A1R0H7A3_9FUNG|nr:hypothetical protein AYI68_g726 [Smittium mucronatum]